MGKSATALLETGTGRYASAFCVHPDGLFVTNDHALQGNPTQIKLILNSGQSEQLILTARPVRRDKEHDLALLKVEKAPKTLPYLKLGSEVDLTELMDVVAFGFPFGRGANLRPNEYPAVSVNMGAINSLPRRDGRLSRIQLNVAVNPGNSGGPLLDMDGRIVGVIVGRIEGVVGAGIDLAIPVGHLEAFLDRPEITFDPSTLSEGDLGREARFVARVVSILPIPEPLKLDLVIDAGTNRQRRVAMSRMGDDYLAKVVPAAPRTGPNLVGVEVTFQDGALTGKAEDRPLKVGDREIRLGELRSLRVTPDPKAELADGTSVEGPVSGLDGIPISMGGRKDRWDLGLARTIKVERFDPVDVINCLVIASNAKGEVGRVDQVIYGKGVAHPTFDALREGRFIWPFRSFSPKTYLKMESSTGDYIGQGKNYEYVGDQLTMLRSFRGVVAQAGSACDFKAEFGGPLGEILTAGEYPGAKRLPFSQNAPGIEINGGGRGCNMIEGKFVVWELEFKGQEVVRVAIDFVQRCEARSPSLVGMLRYRSNYQ